MNSFNRSPSASGIMNSNNVSHLKMLWQTLLFRFENYKTSCRNICINGNYQCQMVSCRLHLLTEMHRDVNNKFRLGPTYAYRDIENNFRFHLFGSKPVPEPMSTYASFVKCRTLCSRFNIVSRVQRCFFYYWRITIMFHKRHDVSVRTIWLFIQLKNNLIITDPVCEESFGHRFDGRMIPLTKGQ